MAMKLIVESNLIESQPVHLLKESANPNGQQSYYIEGIYIQTNVKNRNGRVYPKQLMEQCVSKYVDQRMRENTIRSFGELGHPDGVEINLDKVCHYITEFRWDGNDCIGKSKVLNKHPSGRILETFLEEGLCVGVSTRGIGALSEQKQTNGSKLVEAYDMIAVDVVADPSAPKGFVDGIMENKEYIIQDNGIIVECYENLERKLCSLPKDSELRNALFLEELKNFLKNV